MVLTPVAGLSLASNRKDEDRVDHLGKAIESDVPARVPADDELAIAVLDRAPDQRAVREDVQCLDDLFDSLRRIGGARAKQVIDEPLEVLQDLRRQLDAGHQAR